MLNALIDKRDKVSKQAQKSLCVIFQNKKIERLLRPLSTFQGFVTNVFNQQLTTPLKGASASSLTRSSVLVLNFLSAAFQLMPISLCADLDMKVLRLASVEDSQLKTRAYLTLEVLYASRRFHENLDHVEAILR